MEWVIIILLIIFVIMVVQLPYDKQKVSCHKNITMNDTYKESTDLVMLPNPNPTPLITHITL